MLMLTSYSFFVSSILRAILSAELRLAAVFALDAFSLSLTSFIAACFSVCFPISCCWAFAIFSSE